MKTTPKIGLNYKISRFFLNNHRLAIMALALLVLLGVGSTMLMKTTGFPNPPVSIVLVQTVYPGASSETVAKEVTQPIEGAIKDIPDIETYSSQSINSVSVINIMVAEDANVDGVRSQIDSAVKSVDLPKNSETPNISVPDVMGPTLIFSIASNNLKDIYTTYEKVNTQLAELPETARIEAIVPIERILNVQLDTKKMEEYGVTADSVQQQLASLGETLPVVANATIDDTKQTIQTSIETNTVEDIRNIEFTVQPQPTSGAGGFQAPAVQPSETYRLDDFAKVQIDYRFKDETSPLIGLRSNAESVVVPALTVQLFSAEGTEVTQYTEAVRAILADTKDATFILPGEESKANQDNLLIVEHFAVQKDNERQVDEVISGLIGGPLNIDSQWKQIGWLLGGMQLVFLVMIAFVSWRSAIVAALAIPLSLLFANIYLYLTGNDLNTLVLFSLVLVIGLVVDPALVILESIQRKIDTGLKGKEAALAAIADVGRGLFLATLTNIIVFAPFAVISGILGAIFQYIPLTIIPAIIGSYIVPLIFLAWMGGLFLRRKKGSHEQEEENLWGVARWLIRANTKILNANVFVRGGIITVALLIPMVVAGYYFATQKISVVQFSSGKNSELISMSIDFVSTATQDQENEQQVKAFTSITKNSAVQQVFPMMDDGAQSYYITIDDEQERGDYTTDQVVDDIQHSIKDPEHILYDVQVQPIFAGPPKASYQVALAIHNQDAAILRTAALDVSKVLQQVCVTNKQVTISAECNGGERIVTKVNDGYTGKESHILNVAIDRNALQSKGLVPPAGPVSILVNSAVREQFQYNNNEPLQTIDIDGYDTDVYIEPKETPPNSTKEIKDIELAGDTRVDDIADITEQQQAGSVQRVNGQTLAVVQARLAEGFDDQATAAMVTTAIVDYYADQAHTKTLKLEPGSIDQYSEGFTASSAKSFQELFLALILAVVFTYIVLAVFFESFTLPLVILFTIPLTFLGVFPGIYHFANAQFGFFEIIGMIILIGIVENVAIFLIDAARQKMEHEQWDAKRAIAYASGIRFRPVILTKFTATASLLPLAVLSDMYRSLAVVIMCGLITSGITSLFTTPILFIFFRWVSKQFWALSWWKKILFLFTSPLYCIVLGIQQRKK